MTSPLNGAKWASVLSLFTSSGTLICCALPALLVAVGAGATLSALISAAPQLVWLSQYKASVFGAAGLMLILAGFFQWRARFAPCPVDPALAQACLHTRKISLLVYLISLGIFLLGGFFAFIAPLLIK